jgi:hypothetical protein
MRLCSSSDPSKAVAPIFFITTMQSAFIYDCTSQYVCLRSPVIAPSTLTTAKVIVTVTVNVTTQLVKQSLPPCSQVNSVLSNAGHAGSAVAVGAAIYTWWTGVTVPYLTAIGVASGVADLASVGLNQIPGCQ